MLAFDIPGRPQLGDNRNIRGGFAIGQAGNEERLVNYAGNPKMAEAMTVHFAVLNSPRRAGQNPVWPAIGFIDFASGGGLQTRIEFDLPSPRPFGGNLGVVPAVRREDRGNVLAVTVAGASCNAGARLDSSLGFVNDPTAAIGGGVNNDPADPDLFSLRVSVWLSHLPQAIPNAEKLRRVVYISGSSAPASALAPASSVTIAVPNLARRVRFYRNPLAQSLNVRVNGLISVNTLNAIAAGSIGPLDLQNDAFTMLITNTGAADIMDLAVEFELSI